MRYVEQGINKDLVDFIRFLITVCQMIFGKHINKYYLKYSWILIIGILALVAVDYFQLKIPEIYSTIVDGFDPNVTDVVINKTDLSNLCLEMLIIIAVLIIGRFLWRICFFGSAIKVETDIRRKLFNHCKDLSQQFYQKNKVGNLMSLYTNDLETINECFGDGVLMLFDALVLGGMALYKMAKINAMLTLLALIPMVLMGIISLTVGRYMMKKWQIRQEAFSELSDYSQESFSGIAVIKAFVKETKELMAFKKVNKNNENANVEFVKASVILNVSVTLFVQSVICIILGVGGYLAYKGTFTSGNLIEFIGYFNSIVWPIMAVSRLIEMSSRGKASLKRISDILNTPIDVKDNENVRKDISKLYGTIEFKNLTFRYPDADYDALSNVSFTIKQGENVGIIGKTGSGKSTLVDLILRTYNVSDNTLFIDGYDVNTLPIKLVRENAAYVPQDNFLFSDTILRNIAFAYEGIANKDDVIKVSKLADLDDNINDFSQGYDTMLGERGVTISGGQKQRTSIARALLKDAPILILDDSVSAVDTKTERKILDNLKNTRKGKTTILIAHRITTIENMDKILFIDDGKVVAFDSHDNLINSCQEYKKMVDLQKLEDEIGGEK